MTGYMFVLIQLQLLTVFQLILLVSQPTHGDYLLKSVIRMKHQLIMLHVVVMLNCSYLSCSS